MAARMAVEQCQHLFYFVDLNYVLCKSLNYCLVKVKWRSPCGIYAVCHPKILFRKKKEKKSNYIVSLLCC